MAAEMKCMDLTGQRFGRLVALSKAKERTTAGRVKWICKCDCGNVTTVAAYKLRSGHSRSCGCYAREFNLTGEKTHGMSKSKLYFVWVSMKQRCYNPNDANYFRYGGRGITVCDEWRDSFEAFRDWALANGYREGETDLDRGNNDKGYSPENCRFISHHDNLRNTHRKLHDTIRGADITLSEAAEKYGLSYALVYQRYKNGKRGDELIEPSGNKVRSKGRMQNEKE